MVQLAHLLDKPSLPIDMHNCCNVYYLGTLTASVIAVLIKFCSTKRLTSTCQKAERLLRSWGFKNIYKVLKYSWKHNETTRENRM